MTGPRTSPPITDEQNTERNRRFLAAQHRLYARAKSLHGRRQAVVLLGAVAGLAVGAADASARTYAGGITVVVLLLFDVLSGRSERNLNRRAASVQELFDTGLFGLGWHDHLADRPSEWELAESGDGAVDDRFVDWYQPRSLSTLTRPLDVLVCQRANLDYGVALHRRYSRAVGGTLLLAMVITFGLGFGLDYTLRNFLLAIALPLIPVVRSGSGEAYAHHESAEAKENAQDKVAQLWRRAVDDPSVVDDSECRGVQDCILTFRKTNAHVPDWFYNRRRSHNEAVMLASCSTMVEEATRAGHAVSTADGQARS
jgi:hypothetical protein